MISLLANPFVKWFGIGSAIAIALLTAALGITRNTLHNVRQQAKLEEQQRIAAKAKIEAAWQAKLADATSAYATQLTSREPIILHSKETVTRYAQTDAGRRACLNAERVRGVKDLDASLASPAAATGNSAMRDPGLGAIY